MFHSLCKLSSDVDSFRCSSFDMQLLPLFMLKSIGISCSSCDSSNCGVTRGGGGDDIAEIFERFSRIVAVLQEFRLIVLALRCGGDVGGVIDTTISSLSTSSSSSLLMVTFDGDCCDLSTASKYRLVSSSADLLLLLLLFGAKRLLLLVIACDWPINVVESMAGFRRP